MTPCPLEIVRSYILGVCVLASWAFTTQAVADTADAGQARPKIGLALSGGGARGVAHIGVLEVLEELRIPIDYIAGTSMGAIVGGFYATGMSTVEIAETVEIIDWEDVFEDLTTREERSFRRKRDDDLYLVKVQPGVSKDGVKFPPGVVQGQKIELALTRFTRHAAHIDHFDDFVIPFRAVAADIVTGEAVVLEDGNLGRAVRASMSVPAVFSPTVIGGRMLVDGGVANNLPVDIVRAMGADIVIAVDISTPLLPEEKLETVIAITEQLTGFLTRRNTEAQISSLTDSDILLVPDLGDITSADFERTHEIIAPGRAAAEANLDKLARHSLDPAAYAAHRDGLEEVDESVPTIDFIRLDNQSRVADSILNHRIVYTKVGEPFSLTATERDVSRIYGLDIFQNVAYDVVEENGRTGLEFQANERSWGPTYLQLGASYNSNNDGDNLFNIGISTLQTGLNDSLGELRLAVQVGEEPAVLADYHQPFGAHGMWFTNVVSSFGDRVLTVFENDTAVADYELREALIESSVGRELGTWGEARMGVRYVDGDAAVRVGDQEDNPQFVFQRGELFARFFVDELDSFYFPRTGFLTSLEWTASRGGLGADEDFEQIDISGAVAKSWGKHTLISSIDFRSTISGKAPIQSLFRAGGFLNLSGYNGSELSGQHYGRLSVAYYRRFGSFKFLPIYAGVALETGNVFENRDDISFGNKLYAGSLFIGAETLIGPLYAAYGNAEGGADAFYIFLGRAF